MEHLRARGAPRIPADVLGMDVANFIAAAFVGRIEDEQAAAGRAADAARPGRDRLRARTGVAVAQRPRGAARCSGSS
ncbi:MAG: hypothetical protein WKF76_08280 [Nocardioidaceae bacterium]